MADLPASASAAGSQRTDSQVAPQITEQISEQISLASEFFRRREYEAAQQVLRPLLVAHSDHFQAIFLLARCQAELGQLDSAIETLAQIPFDSPQVKFAVLGQSADWFIQLERYDEALDRLRQIVHANQDIAIAHRRLAHILDHLGRRYEAAPHLRSLVRLGVATEDELDALGMLSEPHLHPTLVDHPDEMVEIPLNALSLAKRAWTWGNHRESEVTMEQLVVEMPDSVATVAFAMRVFSQLHGQQPLLDLLSLLPNGIEDSPDYWYALAHFYQDRGEHSVAIRCFLETVYRDQTDRYAYLGLARSLELNGQEAVAEGAFKRYRTLDHLAFLMTELNRSAEIYQGIASTLRQLNRDCEALAWERIAAKDASNAPESLCESRPTSDLEATALCGLSRSDWPLPDALLAGSSKAITLQPFVDSDAASNTAIALHDVAKSTGLNFQYRPGPTNDIESLAMHETNGGGIAAVDFDLDGWPDLAFAQSGGVPPGADGKTSVASQPNALFRNLEGKTWVDVAALASCDDRGYGQGMTTADLNQDGFPEILVANFGTNAIFFNNGDGTFTRSDLIIEPAELSEDDRSSDRLENSLPENAQWTTSIACGDLNGDHLPDLVEVNYINDLRMVETLCSGTTERPQCNPQQYRAAEDRFLQLTEDGTWKRLELKNKPHTNGYGFAAMISNFDERAGNDVFITNDTNLNHYWLSERSQPPLPANQRAVHRALGETPKLPAEHVASAPFQLAERAELYGCAYGVQGMAQSCMGVTAGDFDRNGRLDLHVTNYTDESSDLFLQGDSGVFANRAVASGLDQETRRVLGWGTQAVDLDCDGWLDLVILNGHLYNHTADGAGYRMAPHCFRGGRGPFELVLPDQLGDDYWSKRTLGRALATLDWNCDGKTDLVAGHLDAPTALLENQSTTGNWIRITLAGTISERDAVGAKVIANVSKGKRGQQQAFSSIATYQIGGNGYLSKNENSLTIGLGANASLVSLEIHWPSGTISRFSEVDVNGSYLAVEQGTRRKADNIFQLTR
ncbi:FG-GAP-like repeat-containing protein [Novipirellula herctigrandis]|uniref:FG-GAP-like repeat-containing protein n=1 Tax=Novipirellula herctigrandis TaxID=2527986 RepID=UPI003AF3F736